MNWLLYRCWSLHTVWVTEVKTYQELLLIVLYQKPMTIFWVNYDFDRGPRILFWLVSFFETFFQQALISLIWSSLLPSIGLFKFIVLPKNKKEFWLIKFRWYYWFLRQIGEDVEFNKPKFCASDGGNTALAALYVIIGAFDWFCTLLHKTLLIGTFFSKINSTYWFI